MAENRTNRFDGRKDNPFFPTEAKDASVSSSAEGFCTPESVAGAGVSVFCEGDVSSPERHADNANIHIQRMIIMLFFMLIPHSYEITK